MELRESPEMFRLKARMRMSSNTKKFSMVLDETEREDA